MVKKRHHFGAFSSFFLHIYNFFCTFAVSNPRSSAVGSAPRSGRGGRAFESPLLDKKGQECPFFVMVMYAESPINHLRITKESLKNN